MLLIHTAKIVQEWFAEHEGEVGHLDWPPQSPDLNIIEHLWGYLVSKLRARFPPPSMISALETLSTKNGFIFHYKLFMTSMRPSHVAYSETYIQFAARLTANFQYYCSLRKVNSFESLCDLIISDKLYETLNKETATHIGIREAEDWFRPIDLAKECDIYISSRSGSHKEIPITYGYTQDPFKNRSQNFKPKVKENYPQYLERENKNCYICGDSSHYARDCAHAYAYSSAISFPNVSVSNVIENSSYDLPHVKNFNTRNDSSSLIKDFKCNKIKITKLKLSIVREKCSDIVLCKKANSAMKRVPWNLSPLT
ncbi:DUF1758 domain-containing protein [Trichonephila clavipes]|nr:DUF1758 domain-containing protein [Trichonephila clavipes]